MFATLLDMVHKNVKIKLITKLLKQETPGYMSVVFERPRNFTYEAGDWVDFDLDDLSLQGGKTYSLSSSPTEPDLMITFKKGISLFKKALESAVPDNAFYITQYGNDYGFHLRENQSSVLIAGGVGIAPFRSMLKEMADDKVNNSVQLIYLNQTSDFLFEQQLTDWQKALPHFKIDYIIAKELNRKSREKTIKTLITNIDQHYYIAGAPGMVAGTTKLLGELGVQERDIKIDSFGGY